MVNTKIHVIWSLLDTDLASSNYENTESEPILQRKLVSNIE